MHTTIWGLPMGSKANWKKQRLENSTYFTHVLQICYELAIKFNPQCAEAYNNLGVLYKGKNNLERATQCYQLALQINPRFSQTLNNLGVIYTIQGKVCDKESIASCTKLDD